ncbi:RDD family protein [Snuella sedimenti]|uniref:RDD family protein n=1 Tax=Snuella sedimenti TaxID=2798802 RepID=A0A8J7IGF1_9FLAO|nr:RDD family protein [Snuella sedimenti]MBJ6367518.1 RDD family protein [Snuella sedimenti]
MENEFKRVMSERTDEELIKIVTVERERYNPIAIEAAESEIEKRKLNISEFGEIIEEATIEKEQKQKVDSNVVSSGIRFLNFLIDFIIWLIIATILTMPLGANNGSQMLLGYVIMFLVFIGYYGIMEVKFQKTVGKFITKTKVVKLNGEKPEKGDIITRTFCRLIPFDRLSFLFVKNGFHDSLSKTKVIKDQTK